jgi:glycosyltransferase involved in cell wall biosynthesis
MKIGFLHKVNTTPPRSGGSVHTYQVSQYLAQKGYTLLTLENEKGSQFSGRFPRSWSGLKGLIDAADILYFRVDGRAGWEILSLIPGLIDSRKPIIWEINATLEELKVLPEPIRLRDRLGSVLRSLSAKRANAALCVSEPLVRYAKELGIQNAILNPNGSDPNMFNSNLRNASTFPGLENRFRVLWAGSTDYSWHDFSTFLACASKIQAIDSEIGFAVVGNRPDACDQPIPENVFFYPAVPYLEVPKYFASADVGLCLYREIPWSKYGFFFSPLKLFDYAASGLPVIYTAFTELDRVACNMGFKVPIGDVDALSEQILKLKNNPDLYTQVSQKARQSVLDYYNWNRVGQQTEDILLWVSQGNKLEHIHSEIFEQSLKSS